MTTHRRPWPSNTFTYHQVSFVIKYQKSSITHKTQISKTIRWGCDVKRKEGRTKEQKGSWLKDGRTRR